MKKETAKEMSKANQEPGINKSKAPRADNLKKKAIKK